jgi:hypothetical protein
MHHFGNSLAAIIGGAEVGDLDIVKAAAWHLNDDLALLGIKEGRAALIDITV